MIKELNSFLISSIRVDNLLLADNVRLRLDLSLELLPGGEVINLLAWNQGLVADRVTLRPGENKMVLACCQSHRLSSISFLWDIGVWAFHIRFAIG